MSVSFPLPFSLGQAFQTKPQAEAGAEAKECLELYRHQAVQKERRHRCPPASGHLSALTAPSSLLFSPQVFFFTGVSVQAMVDMLGGRLLLTCGGAWVEAEAVLQNKIVALYFASTRCAPSCDFTPLLSDFYVELVEQACPPAPLAVVFVSADCSAQEMEDFLLQLPDAWLALPFHDPYRQ